MSRQWIDFYEDMLKACHNIVTYTTGYEKADFCEDNLTYDATVRNIEILGEAAKAIPVEIQLEFSQIPWAKLTGVRNILIHEYFGINDDILWDIIENKIPELLLQLEAISLVYPR